MKRLVIVTGVLIAMTLSGCQESKDAVQPLSEKDFYKTIGEQIPFETAVKWMDLYRKERTKLGRSETTPSYSVSADQLKSAMTSADELVGIAFHHAIDEAGERHILVIPVDETLTLWTSGTGRVFVDANTGSEITQEVASAWATNYKNEFPDEKWFHFFGKQVFDEMSSLPDFSSVELEPAVSALDLSQQLLLIILDGESDSSGRTELFALVYDASNACPPCAVQ